jgi:hypothetical protein
VPIVLKSVASTSWNLQGLSRSVMGLLYLYILDYINRNMGNNGRTHQLDYGMKSPECLIAESSHVDGTDKDRLLKIMMKYI